MSKEAVMDFLKKALTDADLQAKVVALANQEGYDFSVEELSEAELDAAAGGAIFVKIKGLAGDVTTRDTSSTQQFDITGK